MKIILFAVSSLWMSFGALSQERPPNKTFEVASVKRLAALKGFSRDLRLRGGRITCVCTMGQMIHAAYPVNVREIIGPSWLRPMGPDDWYELIAEPPAGASEADIAEMMRSLLVNRFGFSGHWEKRKTSVYSLQIESSGLKLKIHQPSPGDDKNLVVQHPVGELADPNAPPIKAPHLQSFKNYMTGRLHVEGFATLRELATQLSVMLDRRVVDQSGLAGTYDIVLDGITPEPLSRTSTPINSDAVSAQETYRRIEPDGDVILPDGRHLPGNAPAISSAVRKLGFRLVPTSAQLDYFVVDHVEKIPTAN